MSRSMDETIVIISSGPQGPFTGFATPDTVQKWLNEGFLHLHEGMRTPEHKEVCRCRHQSSERL